jgi:hypothetical protein
MDYEEAEAVNQNKTNSFRELGKVNIKDLLHRLALLNEGDWEKANADKPNKFGALGKAQHIVFRFPKSLLSHLESYNTDLWQEWKNLIRPIIDQTVKPYSYEVGFCPRIMLAKLPAHSEIKKNILTNHPPHSFLIKSTFLW